jgi:hypothetical protein
VKKRPMIFAVFLMLFAGLQFITNMGVPWFQTLRTVDVLRLTGTGCVFGMGLMLLLVQRFPKE